MSAQVELGWNNAELQAGAKNAEGIVKRSAAQMQGALNGLKQVDVGRVLGIGIAGVGFAQLSSGIAEATLRADDNRQAMLAVEGSIEGANRRLREMAVLARSPGLGLDQVAAADVSLRSVGLSAALSERAIREVGNALAAVGKGKADLDGVMLAFTQIVSNNGLKAEELNQIAERVPQIRRILKEAFGTADTEAIQKMQLSATEFIEKTLDGFAKLPRATGALRNSWDNLTDSISQSGAALGEVAVPGAIVLFDDLAKSIGRNRGQLQAIGGATVDFGRIVGGAFGVARSAADIVGQGWQNIINWELKLAGITDGTNRHFEEQLSIARRLAAAQAEAAREAAAHARAQQQLDQATQRLTESQRQSAAFADKMRLANVQDMVNAAARQRALQQQLQDEAAKTRDLSLNDTQRLEDAKKKLLSIDQQLNAVSGRRGGEEIALKLNIEREQVMQRIVTLQQQLGEAQKRANEDEVRANEQSKSARQSAVASAVDRARNAAQKLNGEGQDTREVDANGRHKIVGVKYAKQLKDEYGLSGSDGGLDSPTGPLARHSPLSKGGGIAAFNRRQGQDSQYDLLQQGQSAFQRLQARRGGAADPLFNPAAASAPPTPGGEAAAGVDVLRRMLALWEGALQ